MGVKVNKKAVLKAIEEGKLYANCIPRHYGPATHQEVCRWAGLEIHNA